MSSIKNTFQIFPTADYIDLIPYQYGREYCTPGHAFGPAQRNHFLFHYIISGKGTLVAEDEQGRSSVYELNAGQGFMIFPQQLTTYQADSDDPWVYTWIEFDGMKVRETLESVGLTPETPVYQARSEELRSTLEQEVLFFGMHPDAPAPQHIGHLYLFIDALIRSAMPTADSAAKKLQDIHVQTALRFVERSYANNVSVADIAQVTGLNPSYFGKLFKESVGKTPQQYLIDYRMTKAAELLKLTSLSIAEVGASVGYPNQLHFSRAFKHASGSSPRSWRKEHRKIL